MADTGYRSIEVNVTNNTPANLSVQSASTTGANVGWIAGEQPKVQSVLNQWGSTLWGVMTADESGSAVASVTLMGANQKPLVINFQNLWNGKSKAQVVLNPDIDAAVVVMDAGEENHSQWSITLTPHQQPFPAAK